MIENKVKENKVIENKEVKNKEVENILVIENENQFCSFTHSTSL
jgi:hypothetical protein